MVAGIQSIPGSWLNTDDDDDSNINGSESQATTGVDAGTHDDGDDIDGIVFLLVSILARTTESWLRTAIAVLVVLLMMIQTMLTTVMTAVTSDPAMMPRRKITMLLLMMMMIAILVMRCRPINMILA